MSTLPEILHWRAERHGDLISFEVDGDGALTFREWYSRAHWTASALVRLGISPGTRVGLWFANSEWLDFCVATIGVHLAGAVAVPLLNSGDGRVVGALAAQVGVRAVISSGATDSTDLTAAIGPDLDKRVFVLADLERMSSPVTLPALDGGATASIVFTSGTTETARAIECAHKELAAEWDPDAESSVATFLTSHVIGTNAAQAALASAIVNGHHTVLVQTFDPKRFLDLIERHDVSGIGVTPTLARLLINACPVGHQSSVQTIVVSSAPLDRDTVDGLVAVFPGATVVNSYALSEGGPGLAAVCRPGEDPPIGRPEAGDEIRVRTVSGADAAVGEIGELWIRSGTVGHRCYATEKAPPVAAGDRSEVASVESEDGIPVRLRRRTRILANGWIATGDLCVQDGTGMLRFVGRAEDVVVVGEVNVSTGPIETLLRRHPGVCDAAVFGVAHATSGQQLVAAVVLADVGLPDDLRAFCLAGARSAEVPTGFVVVDALPVTASGKVRKQELRAEWMRQRSAVTGSDTCVDTGSITASTVAQVLTEVLGAPVPPGASYFELGGNSLLAFLVAERLSDRIGVAVPAEWVLEFPTVAELAGRIDAVRM